MLILRTVRTAALDHWLRESHDDGCAPLNVEQVRAGIQVLRANGSELSADETLEIEARLAANAVEPLRLPRRRPAPANRRWGRAPGFQLAATGERAQPRFPNEAPTVAHCRAPRRHRRAGRRPRA